MFLLSSILDLAAAVAEWAIAAGVEEIGCLAVASIASLAGPLAIAAAVVGIILMLVKIFTTKKPPNPIDAFVDNEAKAAGFYMQYEASIDYFQVISDTEGSPRDIGIASGPDSYIVVNSDASLSVGALAYGYDTVLSVAVDYRGYCNILTQIWSEDEYNM